AAQPGLLAGQLVRRHQRLSHDARQASDAEVHRSDLPAAEVRRLLLHAVDDAEGDRQLVHQSSTTGWRSNEARAAWPRLIPPSLQGTCWLVHTCSRAIDNRDF